MNIGSLLPHHARYRPGHLAFVCGEERFSYNAFNGYVNKLANALLACGLAKGDKFATVLPNCTQLMAAYWAAAKTGLVIVPSSTMLDLMPWMFLGATYILHESFNAEAVLADIEKEKVTHVVMVPAQIIAILNSPAFEPAKLASLEMIHNVGAPLLLEYKHRLNEALPGRFYELYGLTEGFMTVLDKHDAVRKVGSVGIPAPFMEMRILDAKGRECAPGEIGEIYGKSPMMMPGYYKRPDLTEKAIVDGWLHTGDLGYVDDEGFLFLVDRIKDMIISGGVNVYPKDIEEVVIRHPGVSEVAVIGVPDEKWGEVLIAAVLHHGATLLPEALIDWTNSRVDAKFQRIRDVVIMESFP